MGGRKRRRTGAGADGRAGGEAEISSLDISGSMAASLASPRLPLSRSRRLSVAAGAAVPSHYHGETFRKRL